MKTLRTLKSRREGIEKINKIARAMEVIAATRLRRYEADVAGFRPFVQAEGVIMGNLALRLKKLNNIWAEPPAQNRKGIAILISSERGFCGGFNNQLFRLIEDLKEEQSLSFIALGKKGAAYLKRHHFNLIEELALPGDAQIQDFVRRITEKIILSYREEQQSIYLIFNKFRQHLLGRGFRKQLLPLEIHEDEGIILDYIFEPDTEAVLEELLPIYVGSEIKAAILESKAAEEMARMVAMTQARRNAEDLIRSLTLQYHKARQTGITRELVEIANAIR